MQINIVKKMVIPKKVEEVITEIYSECDKCRNKILNNEWNGSPFYGEIKLPTGHKSIELCRKCTEELVVLLESNGYRLVEESF